MPAIAILAIVFGGVAIVGTFCWVGHADARSGRLSDAAHAIYGLIVIPLGIASFVLGIIATTQHEEYVQGKRDTACHEAINARNWVAAELKCSGRRT